MLEDIELARAVKRSGGRIALADGSRLATCRMYDDLAAAARRLHASRSGPRSAHPGAAAAVVALLLLLYTAPPLLAVAAAAGRRAGGGSRRAWPAYLLGVAGRVVTARATGGRAWPDALAHPVSVVVLGWLTLRSYHLRKRRRLHLAGPPGQLGGRGMARIVVVGAGVGGLATAARLAATGHQVTVFERADTVGGKLGRYVARHPGRGVPLRHRAEPAHPAEVFPTCSRRPGRSSTNTWTWCRWTRSSGTSSPAAAPTLDSCADPAEFAARIGAAFGDRAAADWQRLWRRAERGSGRPPGGTSCAVPVDSPRDLRRAGLAAR